MIIQIQTTQLQVTIQIPDGTAEVYGDGPRCTCGYPALSGEDLKRHIGMEREPDGIQHSEAAT